MYAAKVAEKLVVGAKGSVAEGKCRINCSCWHCYDVCAAPVYHKRFIEKCGFRAPVSKRNTIFQAESMSQRARHGPSICIAVKPQCDIRASSRDSLVDVVLVM